MIVLLLYTKYGIIPEGGEKLMRIHGFQKMTMLDFPGKVACTVFTAGCNFRCPFCHNSPLVTKINAADEYRTEDIFAYLRQRRGILDGVAITGGEPLLTDGVLDFMKRVKDIGLAVKLDTNGSFPERLRKAVDLGLVDYVAMDVKNSFFKYAMTAGIPNLDLAPIKESISYLLEDNVDYEFRTTIIKEFHTVRDIQEIGIAIKGAKRYFLQNFVDSGELISPGLSAVTPSYMKELQKAAEEFVQKVQIRGI